MIEKIKNISIIILIVILIVCVTVYIKKDMDNKNLENEVLQLTAVTQEMSNREKQEMESLEEDSQEVPVIESKLLIKPEQFNVEKLSEYTLLDEYQIDIDDDATSEYLALYAVVEVMDGDYCWDDGQKWLLLVRDESQEYVIFDDYIQLGAIEAYVYEDLTEDTFHITTLLKASAGISIKDFIFDRNERIFYEKEVFGVSNINNFSQLKLNEDFMD